MSAKRISSDPETVHPYDVLAQTDGASDLMVHALLFNGSEPRDGVTDSTDLKMFHMGPPLGPKRGSADAVGNAKLTADQQKQIKAFVDELTSEKAAEKRRQGTIGKKWKSLTQYRIQPHSTPPTPAYSLWRFSCVGLVLQAYRYAGLLLLEDAKCPLKSVEDLKQLYPSFASMLDDPKRRTMFGIGEGDRWPVTLVGYVLHSLNRPNNKINGPGAIPYKPVEGDEYFPRQSKSGG